MKDEICRLSRGVCMDTRYDQEYLMVLWCFKTCHQQTCKTEIRSIGNESTVDDKPPCLVNQHILRSKRTSLKGTFRG